MKTNLLQQNIKRVGAGLLVIWMSGLIVLFCCEMPSANAAGNTVESCPLAKRSNCSKTSVKDAGQFFGQESHSFDCCGVPAKIFDRFKKLQDAPRSAAVAGKIEISAPKFFAFDKSFEISRFNQSFVRNRGNTYLRNRVFRI